MKKFKIAYILTPITFGGAEKVSLNFLRAIDRNRFDVKPILLVRPWEQETYFARELGRLGYDYETLPVSIKAGGDPLRTFRVTYRLYSILKNGSFRLAHTQGYFADICGLPAAKWLGIRAVSTCHGFISIDWKLRLYNFLDKQILKLSKKLIVVSEGIKNDLIRSGVKESKIVVTPNAVVPPLSKVGLIANRAEKRRALGIAPHEYVVGYLGRLSEEKGVRYLVEAVGGLRDAMVPVKLLLVGDGCDRISLEKQVEEKKLENNVFFAGFQANIENWLVTFDVFVLPSLTEGTPMSMLEAMSMGIPVIATSVGGIPDVIKDGNNGLLVLSSDSEALKEKIQRLEKNPDLQKQLAMEGVRTIEQQYDVHSWCRKIEALYEDIG